MLTHFATRLFWSAATLLGTAVLTFIIGTVLFSGTLDVGTNWVVDLAYRWIDPRIKAIQ
jgi:ABC-type dipeptide/oligopeptide/nickel transport system permease component